MSGRGRDENSRIFRLEISLKTVVNKKFEEEGPRRRMEKRRGVNRKKETFILKLSEEKPHRRIEKRRCQSEEGNVYFEVKYG